MKSGYVGIGILVFTIIEIVFISGCVQQSGQGTQNLTQKELSSSFVCNLIDQRARDVGISGTDLGIGFERNNSIWILFGDVVGTELHKGGASAVLLIPKRLTLDCSKMKWKTENNSFYKPLHSRRQYGDASTVPAGAVEISNKAYIFAMRVIKWEKFPKQTHARGVLFKENESGEFEEVYEWEIDDIHVNTAPVKVGNKIYMIATSLYRKSPLYLAYVNLEDIDKPSKYMYFAGRDSDKIIWSSNPADAKPLEGTENLKIGEVSFVYNPILKKYFILFKSYSIKNNGFWLMYSDKPTGPFEKIKLNVCKDADWMKLGWSGCYGGYIVPYYFGENGRDLYFTVSVWVPYTTVLLKTEFND